MISAMLAKLSAARIIQVFTIHRSGKKITPVNIAPKKAPAWSAPFVTPADMVISLRCCMKILFTRGNSMPVSIPVMPVKQIKPAPAMIECDESAWIIHGKASA